MLEVLAEVNSLESLKAVCCDGTNTNIYITYIYITIYNIYITIYNIYGSHVPGGILFQKLSFFFKV